MRVKITNEGQDNGYLRVLKVDLEHGEPLQKNRLYASDTMEIFLHPDQGLRIEEVPEEATKSA
jgi:hypothetical protein